MGEKIVDLIENGTRGLPPYSIVPQPTLISYLEGITFE
jgi:hypothetical protein